MNDLQVQKNPKEHFHSFFYELVQGISKNHFDKLPS